MCITAVMVFVSALNKHSDSKFIFFDREVRSLADWPTMIAAVAITPILVIPLFLVVYVAWRSISNLWEEMKRWHQ
jgi:hypothetical protein